MDALEPVCKRIFSEKISTRVKTRPKLEAALKLAYDIKAWAVSASAPPVGYDASTSRYWSRLEPSTVAERTAIQPAGASTTVPTTESGRTPSHPRRRIAATPSPRMCNPAMVVSAHPRLSSRAMPHHPRHCGGLTPDTPGRTMIHLSATSCTATTQTRERRAVLDRPADDADRHAGVRPGVVPRAVVQHGRRPLAELLPQPPRGSGRAGRR
ncbi:hypothetical protein [Streptomyces eurythermus]|uniref:hypothetical protein n=1 Tax=Streptomyces eurythermus TaxID=42237 RepID=UPI0036D260BD